MPPKPKTSAKKPAVNKRKPELGRTSNSANVGSETTSGLSQEAEDQFELELCWCIQQLEMCLATGKLAEKQALDLNKNISILKSNNAPLIKKRQIMRNTLGNYREKMALDEQKLGKTTSSIKFLPAPMQNKKCIFLKKASFSSVKKKQYSDNDTTCLSADEPSIDIDNLQTVFKFNFQIKE
ncbi:UPF0488 protein CG14286 [Osmia bicornis bicornis]|uniref:UPF0488 protein CG14286 n=1 Tax=Osmia bicornis bicornis TaxID=1437191 RepID=UPI0010F51D08|nr:UPF0488 protein CG14286 [Osmia bicornis bicornis]